MTIPSNPVIVPAVSQIHNIEQANRKVISMRFLLTAIFLLTLPQVAAAELLPEEVAVIALKHSQKSVELAEYYVRARKIPENRICLIEATPGDVLSREEWQTVVRPAIRRWIVDNELETKLRCLVTVWDVPLKIGRSDNQSRIVNERTAYLEGEWANRVVRTLTMIEATNKLLLGKQRLRPLPPESADLKTLVKAFESAFKAAQARLKSLKDTPERKAANNQLANIFAANGGLKSLLRNLKAQQALVKKTNQTLDKQIATATGRLSGLRDGRVALEGMPESVERDQQLLALIDKGEGLLTSLAWISAQQQLLERNETYASFDSELSLLYWPAYPLGRWQPNVLHYRYDGSYTRWLRKTLMVSRLEAPTFELTKKLIDTAIQVEKQGLDGKFYIDSRGIAKRGQPYQRNSKEDFDAILLNLDSVLKTHAGQTVILDTNKELFQKGDCPNAALYCGWYSLANYVDAFQWIPGAVGYHLASAEASTLRKPDSKVWCKRMLEEGVCATLGPVHEPYLIAFPRPNEFFTLLLSGKHTLVECYYRSKLFNSWVMVLIGDPLYNPYRRNPAITDKGLPAGLKRLIEVPAIAQP